MRKRVGLIGWLGQRTKAVQSSRLGFIGAISSSLRGVVLLSTKLDVETKRRLNCRGVSR